MAGEDFGALLARLGLQSAPPPKPWRSLWANASSAIKRPVTPKPKTSHRNLTKPMPTIKPIETRAYGCRFRSRLEARWAVFFTAMGLKWEYEPEGFDMDGTFYLPDFRVWTPQSTPIWYEVKPFHVAEDVKFARFQEALHEQAGNENMADRSLMLSGSPSEFFANHIPCPRCGVFLDVKNTDGATKSLVEFLCHDCDWETPCGGGNPPEPGIHDYSCYPQKGWIVIWQKDYMDLRKRVMQALVASRSARFEHGKSP